MLDLHWETLNQHKRVTADIVDNYVSTFGIFQIVSYLQQGRNIYQTLYVRFYNYYGLLLLQILIYQCRINRRHYVLVGPIFTQNYNKLI